VRFLDVRIILAIAFSIPVLSGSEHEYMATFNTENVNLMTQSEATEEILTLKNQERVAAAELKSSLKQVPAYYQAVTIQGEREIVMRRVAAPAELPSPPSAVKAGSRPSFDLSQWDEADVIQLANIYLHATVYDDSHSKLVVNFERERYTVWTNLNFKYLQLLGSFSTADRRYNYFGPTCQIDPEQEAINVRLAAEKGFTYTSRWEDPPVPFAAEPEYVLVAEEDRAVPEEVYRQLDDLLGYYMANQERLRIEYHNDRQLRAAHERYRQAHPQEPQDIVLNYSRMSAPTE